MNLTKRIYWLKCTIVAIVIYCLPALVSIALFGITWVSYAIRYGRQFILIPGYAWMVAIAFGAIIARRFLAKTKLSLKAKLGFLMILITIPLLSHILAPTILGCAETRIVFGVSNGRLRQEVAKLIARYPKTENTTGLWGTFVEKENYPDSLPRLASKAHGLHVTKDGVVFLIEFHGITNLGYYVNPPETDRYVFEMESDSPALIKARKVNKGIYFFVDHADTMSGG